MRETGEEPKGGSVRGVRRELRNCVWLFLALSVLYHSNLRPVASADSLGASLIPFSIVLDHSVALDRFSAWLSTHAPGAIHTRGEHAYSVYPIAGPVLVSIAYVPFALAPQVSRMEPAQIVAIARVVEKVVAVTLAALTGVVMLLFLRRLTGRREAWLLMAVFALGTANWSTSSQAMWQHSFGGLAIAACLYAVARWSDEPEGGRWHWLAGVFAGCALAIRPTSVMLLPAMAAALFVTRARLPRYVQAFTAPVAAGLVTAAYNYVAVGRVSGQYGTPSAGHFWAGLPGLLLSPGRGLLIYTPVALFAACAFLPAAREARRKQQGVFVAAAVFAALHTAVVAKWPIWWGGYCWGPRLLTEVLPPIMALIAIGLPALSRPGLKHAFAVAALWGCFIQGLGVYCYPKGHWDNSPETVNHNWTRLWNWKDNPVGRTFRGGVAWEPYAIVWTAVREGLPAAGRKLQELGINPY